MSERDRLAEFHRTLSEQLNSRLSESPKFFWVLIVVSAGYGYVLWFVQSKDEFPDRQIVVTLAAVLSYVAVLWASYYLAALGYAFRFLQNCQHCIERALGWDESVLTGKRNVEKGRRRPGKPPANERGLNAFWLLPGIYHAHIAGLSVFLTVVVAAFCWHLFVTQPHWPKLCVILACSLFWMAGLWFMYGINQHYLRKFNAKRLEPDDVDRLRD